MGRILGFFFVSLSLPAAAQVAINYGYATSMPSTVQVAPLLAPPNVALPGSGTPFGAPVSISVNNARYNDAVGDVYIPGSTSGVIVTQPVSIATPVTESLATTMPAAAATSTGAGQPPPSTILALTFIDGNSLGAAKAAAPPSLGEVAARFRSQKPAQPGPAERRYTNNDVFAMAGNTATFRGQTVDLPQSEGAKPESDKDTEPENPRDQSQLDLQRESNDKGVLDARDLRDVEAAVERSKKQPR